VGPPSFGCGDRALVARAILLTRRDWVAQDTTTFSGGGWVTDWHILSNPRPQTVLQALSIQPEHTQFVIDFGQQRNNVGLFHFQRLNLTSLSTMRLRAGLDPTFTTNAYDTGTVTGWPKDKTAFTVNSWGETTVNGVYEPEEYAALGMHRFFIPPAPIVARYVKVEIVDLSSLIPAQIGCFGAYETWQPLRGLALSPMGPDLGFSRDWIDESDIQTAAFGSRYFIPRGKRQRWNLGFSQLALVDYMRRVLGWLAYVGKTTPLAIAFQPDDTANLEKNAIWGTLSQDVAVDHPFFATARLPLVMEQLI
jgi:hypothetical protein